MDRNELTKQLYCNVLMEMCKTRNLLEITVSDLIEEAHTARQTFYNHFTDMNDLICYAGFQPMMSVDNPFTDYEGTCESYRLAQQNRDFFHQLAEQTGQNNFWETMEAWLKQTYYERFLIDDLTEQDRMYRKTCIDLYCAGSASVFRDWCAKNLQTPAETLAEVMYAMSPDFVKDVLSRMPEHVTDYPR